MCSLLYMDSSFKSLDLCVELGVPVEARKLERVHGGFKGRVEHGPYERGEENNGGLFNEKRGWKIYIMWLSEEKCGERESQSVFSKMAFQRLPLTTGGDTSGAH